MKIVLLRVGIDTGAGGIHSPLFADGSFEFIPIPDRWGGAGVDERTYGNTFGRHGRPLAEYFPPQRRATMANSSMHADPEWETYTYGDPTVLKGRLRCLQRGDLLVFYAGLQRRDIVEAPALYIVGYFNVEVAGKATDFAEQEREQLFAENFHVRHRAVFEDQKDRLVLVKGSAGSRLLDRAVRLSELGRDHRGWPIHTLSGEMRGTFGDFGGRVVIQRSSPRWVRPEHIADAAAWVRSLE